jgi:hypothetical protein
MRDEDTVERLRAELVRTGGAARGRGAGYPVALRAQVLAYADERRAAGEKLTSVAARVGLSPTTISKWRRRPEPAFARVKVSSVVSGIVLVSPSGWRAEVDVGTLSALVTGRA